MGPRLWFVVFLTVIIVKVNCDLIRDEINSINSMQSSWTADYNSINGFDVNYFKKKLGIKSIKNLFKFNLNFFKQFFHKVRSKSRNSAIPKNYDARKAWPNCTVISSIKDQSNCGSCWAVATASMLSDRLCTVTKGKINRHLSSEDLLRCCHECKDDDNGCEGGDIIEALLYLNTDGIVSGGDYGSQEGCMPYSFRPCYNSSKIATCMNTEGVKSEKCYSNCTNIKYPLQYEDDKIYTDRPYLVLNRNKAIETEIMSNGPLITLMDVYRDLIYYKSGIYNHITGEKLGSHAVRLIGWGNEKGVDYWLASNSWGTSWGDNGTFRIRRQKNGCKFGEYSFGTEPMV